MARRARARLAVALIKRAFSGANWKSLAASSKPPRDTSRACEPRDLHLAGLTTQSGASARGKASARANIIDCGGRNCELHDRLGAPPRAATITPSCGSPPTAHAVSKIGSRFAWASPWIWSLERAGCLKRGRARRAANETQSFVFPPRVGPVLRAGRSRTWPPAVCAWQRASVSSQRESSRLIQATN